jgi:hypothetical protein
MCTHHSENSSLDESLGITACGFKSPTSGSTGELISRKGMDEVGYDHKFDDWASESPGNERHQGQASIEKLAYVHD